MFCKLCQDHRASALNANSTWITEGYKHCRLDKVKEHEQSAQHTEAVRLEAGAQMSINESLDGTEGLSENEYAAVKCAMKCLHFLIKHNIPHTTVFKDFIQFATDVLLAPQLQCLNVGKNAKYTSYRITDEFVNCMANEIEEIVTRNVSESPAYTIMIDESTDIAMRKHLITNVKYVDKTSGEVKTEFLQDVQIIDGKADTIFHATKNVIENKLGIDNLSAFGSDGCNTMIGRKNGVATKIKELKPEVINIHCHNHRLALAAKDSFESIPMFRDLDDTITHVYKYYHGSAVRSQSLEKMQKVLNDTDSAKTIKNASHTRWLSHLNAVTSLRDAYEAVVADLENSTVGGKDIVRLGSGPSAAGLIKKLKTVRAVHVIHFLCDALKPLTQLALVFEKNNIDLSTVHPRLQTTLLMLKDLKAVEGPSMKKVPRILESFGLSPKEQEIEAVKSAEKLFIDNLVENINNRLENSEIIDRLSIFNFADLHETCTSLYGNDEILELANFLNLDSDEALYEWNQFKTTCVDSNSSQVNGPMAVTRLIHKLSKTTGNIFPAIAKMAATAAVLPLSTAEVERMFSDVKRTVTILRNRLTVENVQNLLMIHHNDHYLDFDNVGMR